MASRCSITVFLSLLALAIGLGGRQCRAQGTLGASNIGAGRADTLAPPRFVPPLGSPDDEFGEAIRRDIRTEPRLGRGFPDLDHFDYRNQPIRPTPSVSGRPPVAHTAPPSPFVATNNNAFNAHNFALTRGAPEDPERFMPLPAPAPRRHLRETPPLLPPGGSLDINRAAADAPVSNPDPWPTRTTPRSSIHRVAQHFPTPQTIDVQGARDERLGLRTARASNEPVGKSTPDRRPAVLTRSTTGGPDRPRNQGSQDDVYLQGPEGRLQSLMQRLGIQRPAAGRSDFMHPNAPPRDRERLPAQQRVRPPDAYHSGPTAPASVVNDPRRIGRTATNRAAAANRWRPSLGYAGLDGQAYGVSAAGRFGTSYVPGPYESRTTGPAYNPSTAMYQSNEFGAGWSNTAMGNANGRSYGYGIGSGGMGSASPSSLMHPGSPSDLGSQAGSPSSIYTIGSGNTLSGTGTMPGPGGIGTSTGAGTFGANGPMGAAGS